MNRIYKSIIAGILLGTSFFGSAQGMSLRVMTYNIRRDGREDKPERLWLNRASRVIALCKNLNPDIIGFQEVMQNQMGNLRESFQNMNFIGESRGSSWFVFGPDEATPIAYKKDRFTLQEQGTFSVNATVDSRLGWMPWHVSQTGLLPRICTWVKLKDIKQDKEFYVYNTHLDHKYEQARINSAQKITQDIKERTAGLPVIIMGDLNTPFEGDIKKVFDGFQHAKDAAVKCEGPCETSTGWDDQKLKNIDHILVRNVEKIETHRVIESQGYPSDHRPVVAEVVL